MRHQQPKDQHLELNKGFCDAEVNSCYHMAELIKRALLVELSRRCQGAGMLASPFFSPLVLSYA